MKSRLYKKYKDEIAPALKTQFKIDNILAVPKIEKVTLSVGVSSRHTESNYLETIESTLTRISGQKPVRSKAKQAISAFKTKLGQIVGAKVTLRGQRMYDFLDKLVNISLPRIRDFRGISVKSVDKQGNLSIGFREHNVFPEIKSDEIERIHGLEVTITSNAGSYEQGLELFKMFGFPFQKNTNSKSNK